MKYLLALLLSLTLVGCSTSVPVKRNFPSVPEELLVDCPELKKVAQGTTKLSEVLVVVTDNYSTYHECRIKLQAWQEWYKSQKEIFDSIN
jgi:hypothetical protein